MSPPRLHCPDLKTGDVELPDSEVHHALTVLRMKPGDRIILFNGRGDEGQAEVSDTAAGRLRVTVLTVESKPFELSIRLTLAVALGRQQRQAYVIEKCTELGVAAVWPLISDRSVAKPQASITTKWQRRAIEAAKQSARAWVPQIEPPMPFDDACRRAADFPRRIIADPTASAPLATLLGDRIRQAMIFIGPEGGWTDDERRRANAAGISPARLAPTVLRTETAAVAACATVAMLALGDADSWQGEKPL